MRIINIVDSVEEVNYGIWHAAIVNAELLAVHGIRSELWYPEKQLKKYDHITGVPLPSISKLQLEKTMQERELNKQEDIIVTHGAWKYATRWGATLKDKGFCWTYVPQGMLEPWAMQQKRLKKWIYFSLFEKRMAGKADWIRSVSATEQVNLQKIFGAKVKLVPNGVKVYEQPLVFKKNEQPRTWLFLSRLHEKKNIIALAQAWVSGTLNNNPRFQLKIAGPDQGELEKLQPFLLKSDNIQYLGSVFGDKKKELLQSSSFFVLPSFSEGLPSSLLEAMSYGLVPVITEGCNLSEVFSANLGVRITTDAEDIRVKLEETSGWTNEKINNIAKDCYRFIADNYSLNSITNLQLHYFHDLLQNRSVN